MGKCDICFNQFIWLVRLQDSDKNNVKWFTKLQDIIPEMEWPGEYTICQDCSKKVEDAWEFRKFVLSRSQDQNHCLSTHEIHCEVNFKDTYDLEYFSKVTDCELCFKVFRTESQLDQHKLEIHGEQISKNWPLQNRFTCYNCNVTFSAKEKLIHHFENKHRGVETDNYKNPFSNKNKEKQFNETPKDCVISEDEVVDNDFHINHEFYCSTCSLSYSTKEMLQTHFKMCVKHPDDKQLIETQTANKKEENNPDFDEYDSHILEHNVEEPEMKKRRGRKPLRTFTCEICNKEFDYVKLVTDHCVSIHAMDIKLVKPYSCELCVMRFASSANLDQHRNYHSKNRTHICSLCGKAFITKSDLTVHEYTHYNRRNYKCTLCDKAFNTNKNLRTHNLVVHTDRNLWKYACSVCEKRFPLKTNYDQHLRRHTGEKDFACHICKKLFISKSELQRHIHMHSNMRAFKCSSCDKEYKERRSYLAHLTKKHGIGNAKITVREKKFVCHICPSQFYDKQKLMRHICSHSGLKPFPCYICDKRFTDKSYLKHHLKTVHNISQQSHTEEIQ